VKNTISAEEGAKRGVVVGEPYTPPGRTAVFDVPAYDDIADLNQLFKRFANTAAAYSEAGGGAFVDKAASFTITAADLSKTYLVTVTTVSTVTVPDATTLKEGDRFNVIQGGTGKVTVTGPNVVGVSSTPGQYEGLSAVVHGGKWWCIPFGSSGGGGGGGPIPIFNVSADTTLDQVNVGGMVCADTTAKSLNVTVPADNGTIPIGSAIVVTNVGSSSRNTVTLRPAAGVVLQDSSDEVISRLGIVTLVKRAANVWLLSAGSGGGKRSAPGAPQNVEATGAEKSIVVFWASPSDVGSSQITNYFVEYSIDGLSWTQGRIVDGSTLAASVMGLTPGTKYFARVRAVNASGVSDPSDSASAVPSDASTNATGGTVTYFNVGGQWFKRHTFTADGVFEVVDANSSISVLLYGGGGAGGGDYGSGGAGGGSITGLLSETDIPASKYQVKVGAGGKTTSTSGGLSSVALLNHTITANGGSGGGSKTGASTGGTADVGPYVSLTGAQGGSGGAGGSGSGSGGFTDNYDGTGVLGYCGGGGGGASAQGGGGQGVNGGAGGGGYSGSQPGENGGPGVRGGGGGGASIYAYQGGAGGDGSVVFWYPVAAPAEFNVATGGTVNQYESDGRMFRTHTFTESGTLKVTKAASPFRILVVASGDGGQPMDSGYTGNGGAGGEAKEAVQSLVVQDYPVTVGGSSGLNSPGAASSFAGLTSQRGGGALGGAGNPGPGVDTIGSNGSANYLSTISGVSDYYGSSGGGGGGIGSPQSSNGPGTYGRGGHGGSWSDNPTRGQGGAGGVVIVSYEIAAMVIERAM